MNDFIFLNNWYDIIKAYDDAGQPDMANAIAKEIIIYGVTGDTKTTDPLIYGIVKGLCTDQIKRPKARHSIENGNKGGRPETYPIEEMLRLRDAGLTDEEIADNLGCSVQTVIKKLKATSEDEI